MSNMVYDMQGTGQPLAEELAAGGEGSIYPLLNRPDVVVKKYHQNHIGDAERMEKVNALIALYRENPCLRTLPLAWPQIAVYDSQQRWQGYAMKCVQGKKMRLLCNPKLTKKHFPQLTRVQIVSYLLNLLNTAEQLHKQGIFMGDINLDNFIVDPDSEQVYFIDCDSFQISYQGRRYPCPVGQDSMIPPEHQGLKLKEVVRDENSDLFSLTAICFMLLMSGRHPYEHIGGTSITSNIGTGHFPYGQSIRPGSQGAIPQGPWYAWWSHLSYNLKGAFITTFKDAAGSPSQRVRISELKKLLKQYKWSIEQGRLSNEVWPAQVKESEYRSED
ncbi:hypothetical protein ABT56_22070 [Photobacterium aquae]|uniref:Protein kinase domain-containing protein n=2 Tax=Photobacterium aquae TaxID=1195763 RepID=A0A0J1GPB8_9GAMM|nr:hypothetical protein ABT56_22070 [Photobacterium aquae]